MLELWDAFLALISSRKARRADPWPYHDRLCEWLLHVQKTFIAHHPVPDRRLWSDRVEQEGIFHGLEPKQKLVEGCAALSDTPMRPTVSDIPYSESVPRGCKWFHLPKWCMKM